MLAGPHPRQLSRGDVAPRSGRQTLLNGGPASLTARRLTAVRQLPAAALVPGFILAVPIESGLKFDHFGTNPRPLDTSCKPFSVCGTASAAQYT
jgi:hypothetical protein